MPAIQKHRHLQNWNSKKKERAKIPVMFTAESFTYKPNIMDLPSDAKRNWSGMHKQEQVISSIQHIRLKRKTKKENSILSDDLMNYACYGIWELYAQSDEPDLQSLETSGMLVGATGTKKKQGVCDSYSPKISFIDILTRQTQGFELSKKSMNCSLPSSSIG